jgi:hypothetical protein
MPASTRDAENKYLQSLADPPKEQREVFQWHV